MLVCESCTTQEMEEKVTVSTNMQRLLIEIKFINQLGATNIVDSVNCPSESIAQIIVPHYVMSGLEPSAVWTQEN